MIPYPEKYGDAPAQDGASAFGGTLDHGHSRYYVANDFYHMESDATLHILSRFKTYQQTTEYTCGAASALMVDWVDRAGHWQVLIGIDTCGTDTPYDDVLIFADPYDVTDHKQDGYYTYPLGRFFGMWREGPCAQKSAPYRPPFVAAWPKGREE